MEQPSFPGSRLTEHLVLLPSLPTTEQSSFLGMSSRQTFGPSLEPTDYGAIFISREILSLNFSKYVILLKIWSLVRI